MGPLPIRFKIHCLFNVNRFTACTQKARLGSRSQDLNCCWDLSGYQHFNC